MDSFKLIASAFLPVHLLTRQVFLKTPEGFSGLKAIFEIQSLSSRGEVFNLKTKAKFLVELTFYCLAFKTNENWICFGK